MQNHENQELEKAANILKRENNKKNLDRLVGLMKESSLYLPAALPPDTDPALIRRIAESDGAQQPLLKGINPRPAVLENSEGKRFLPVFTSEEQAMKRNQRYPLLLTVPFQTCLELATKEKGMCGIVLNAFDQNITLNTNAVKKETQEKKQVTLTEPQLHAVIRQQFEANILPQALFENPSALLEALRKQEGALLAEMYEQAYPEQLACPYTEEQFDIMVLNIREELVLLRMIMPTEKLVPGTCPMVLVSWNPVAETLRYFGLVKGSGENPAHIFEVSADGSKEDLGDAPTEGNEFQYMIDLHEK